MENTYLLLHPSSAVIVEEIFEYIRDYNFELKHVYRIPNWDKVLDQIYHNTYTKAKTIKMHVHAHAYLNKYFFGNYGLLLILHKDVSYEKMIQDTLEVKKKIRSRMNDTKNGTISIHLNLRKANIEKSVITELPNDEDTIFFSYVHCPDSKQQYTEDFKFFQESDLYRLRPKEINAVLKYHSYT
jgi:hypothetical protein